MLSILGPLLLCLSRDQTLVMWDLPSVIAAVSRSRNEQAGAPVFKHRLEQRGNEPQVLRWPAKKRRKLTPGDQGADEKESEEDNEEEEEEDDDEDDDDNEGGEEEDEEMSEGDLSKLPARQQQDEKGARYTVLHLPRHQGVPGAPEPLVSACGKLVYAFQTEAWLRDSTTTSEPSTASLTEVSDLASFMGGVTCMAAAPVLDVCAVGFGDGAVLVVQLKYDKVLARFRHAEAEGPVVALSFRTDPGNSHYLISGSAKGHVACWDLKQQRLASLLRNAHDASITNLAIARPTGAAHSRG
eukprot:g1005.t1